MNTAFKIFLRAQGLYALFTLPSLLMPPMWLISEMLALSWGLAGLAVFLPVMPVLRSLSLRDKAIILTLVSLGAVGAAFLATYLACGSYESWDEPLKYMAEWWPFPAAGWTAALVSTLSYHRSVVRTVRDEAGAGAPTSSVKAHPNGGIL